MIIMNKRFTALRQFEGNWLETSLQNIAKLILSKVFGRKRRDICARNVQSEVEGRVNREAMTGFL